MTATLWEQLDSLTRNIVRDTFGSPVTYTPRNGSPVSALPSGAALTGEFTPLYEDVSPADTAVPASGPRIEFVRADLTACGITPREGDQVALSVRGQSRSWRVIDVRDADLGSVYLMLGDRVVDP